MDINYLIIFKKVADFGSFSAAADQLGLLKSSVSQKIRQLEQDLGVRLLQRTTRKVSLTEIGERVYEVVGRIVAETEDIRSLTANIVEQPKGLLRVTAPNDLGAYIIDRALSPFLERYPSVEVEMDLSNRYVDLIAEGFDLALRASSGPLKESSLVARSLLTTRSRLYASPQWVARHGAPTSIESLHNATAIVFSRGGGQRRQTHWQLMDESGAATSVQVKAAFRTNDFLAIKRAVLGGFGIALLPEIICLAEQARGALLPLLPNLDAGRASYYVVYPSRRYLPAKTRVFIEFLRETTRRDHLMCEDN